MEKLKLPIFNNITPATFQDSKTYVEQLRILRDKLNEVIEKFPNLKIFALGGIIQNEQIKEIEKTKAYGFESIRYFI